MYHVSGSRANYLVNSRPHTQFPPYPSRVPLFPQPSIASHDALLSSTWLQQANMADGIPSEGLVAFPQLFVVVGRYCSEFSLLSSAPQEQVSLVPPEENNHSQPEVRSSFYLGCN